jgi:hypothetical protein
MRCRMLLLLAFLFVVFGTTSSNSQQQSIPGGRISGQVLDAATGEPLKDARVILRLRGSGNQREVVTDAEGLFVLDDIPPGSYLLHPEHRIYPIQQGPAPRLRAAGTHSDEHRSGKASPGHISDGSYCDDQRASLRC